MEKWWLLSFIFAGQGAGRGVYNAFLQHLLYLTILLLPDLRILAVEGDVHGRASSVDFMLNQLDLAIIRNVLGEHIVVVVK